MDENCTLLHDDETDQDSDEEVVHGLLELLTEKWRKILTLSATECDVRRIEVQWTGVDSLQVIHKDEPILAIMGVIRFHSLHALVSRLIIEAHRDDISGRTKQFLLHHALMLISLSLEQFHDYAVEDVIATLSLTVSMVHDDEDATTHHDNDRQHPLAQRFHEASMLHSRSEDIVFDRKDFAYLWLASTDLFEILERYFSELNSSIMCCPSSHSPILSPNRQASPPPSTSHSLALSMSPSRSMRSVKSSSNALSHHHSALLDASLFSSTSIQQPSAVKAAMQSLLQGYTHPMSSTSLPSQLLSRKEFHDVYLPNKKLALDLSLALVHSALDFDDLAFGLFITHRSLVRYERQVALLFLKLCLSFVVSAPSHWPFMPADCFETVSVPTVEHESCCLKIHSLFEYSHNHFHPRPVSATADVVDVGVDGTTSVAEDAETVLHRQQSPKSHARVPPQDTPHVDSHGNNSHSTHSAHALIQSSPQRRSRSMSTTSLHSLSALQKEREEEVKRRHAWGGRLSSIQLYQLGFVVMREWEGLVADSYALREQEIVRRASKSRHTGTRRRSAVDDQPMTSTPIKQFSSSSLTDSAISIDQPIIDSMARKDREALSCIGEEEEEEDDATRDIDDILVHIEVLLRRMSVCPQPIAPKAATMSSKSKSSTQSKNFRPPSIRYFSTSSNTHSASFSATGGGQRETILLRDKSLSIDYRESSECFLCGQLVRGWMEKYGGFSSTAAEAHSSVSTHHDADSTHAQSSKRRHHCRLCGETICAQCMLIYKNSRSSLRADSVQHQQQQQDHMRRRSHTVSARDTEREHTTASTTRKSFGDAQLTAEQLQSQQALQQQLLHSALSANDKYCLLCDKMLHALVLPILVQEKSRRGVQQGDCDCAYCTNTMTETGMIPMPEALRQWRDRLAELDRLAQGATWKEFNELTESDEMAREKDDSALK